ncbi:hypothetical protein JCM8097_008896 [Rhodosporidiobolus ruineniae]
MPDDPPSAFLPSLHPLPPSSLLASSLSRLSASLQPSNTLIDLRHPLSDLSSGSIPAGAAAKAAREEEQEDEFERGYASGWLERVVAVCSRALAKGEEGWEEVVDGASGLLAFLSGPSAQGSSSKTYLLPSTGNTPPSLPTPPPTRPSSTLPSRSASPTPSPCSSASVDLALTIHETTLLQNSTGHRTWGSAPLLAQRLASSPSSFFPRLPSPDSEAGSAARPLRVLELGSGTGLVGLSAAAVLARSGYGNGASVTLTDGGAEPLAVLDNLRANVAANATALGGVEVRVEELDWRDFLGEGKKVAEEEKFDVILAADVAYEPGMAEALHAAVSGLLRLPSLSSPSSSPVSYTATTPPSPPPSAFHLIIPLRPTHTAESSTVARLFPPPSSSPSPPVPGLVKLDPTSGRAYRLVSREVVELTGPDGFGGGGGRARSGRAEGEMRYCLRRVEWEEIRDLK